MKVKLNKQLWIMKHPDGGVYIDTLQTTKDKCWQKFSGRYSPTYAKEGYSPVKVHIVEVRKDKIEH